MSLTLVPCLSAVGLGGQGATLHAPSPLGSHITPPSALPGDPGTRPAGSQQGRRQVCKHPGWSQPKKRRHAILESQAWKGKYIYTSQKGHESDQVGSTETCQVL